MPQFRTIEEFLQDLENKADMLSSMHALSKVYEARWQGMEEVYREIANIVRTSNLGIVHPPSEDKS